VEQWELVIGGNRQKGGVENGNGNLFLVWFLLLLFSASISGCQFADFDSSTSRGTRGDSNIGINPQLRLLMKKNKHYSRVHLLTN